MTAEMEEIHKICQLAMACIVSGSFEPLEKQRALTRVTERDIRRVLAEYNPNESPVMPPERYFEEAAYINEYNDGSGYHVDINLWYPSGESDLRYQAA